MTKKEIRAKIIERGLTCRDVVAILQKKGYRMSESYFSRCIDDIAIQPQQLKIKEEVIKILEEKS